MRDTLIFDLIEAERQHKEHGWANYFTCDYMMQTAWAWEQKYS
jgi:hypothetical protein